MLLKIVKIKKVDLNKLCKKKGLSVKDLATKAKIDKSSLYKYFNETIKMNEETWERVKKVLDNRK